MHASRFRVSIKKLLHGVSGHNLHALHANARSRLAALAAVAHGHGCIANLAEHIVAFDQFTKSRVLAIEERSIAKANEELTTGRIGMSRTRHGDHAALVRTIVEFRFDFVTRIACAPASFGTGILCQRIAALDHETFDDTMKTGAIVKSFFREGFKILHRLWRNVRPEFQDHFALRGFDDCNFVTHNF